MTKIFLDYTQQELDAQYDQRVWAPDVEEILNRCAIRSDDVRRRLGLPRTQNYGPSPEETLDIYGAGEKALVFVHGGAWRRLSKGQSAFPAETVIGAGAAFVALDFALLPAVSLAEMARQVCAGIQWVQQNLSRHVVVCGHSSGAHLAALALTRLQGIRSALLVSGIYDLLPVRLSSRNAYMRIGESDEQALSPLRHANEITCPVTLAWAEKDSPEFVRQSRAFAARLQARVAIGNGANHFDFIETLSEPESMLGLQMLQMLS